MFQLQHLAGEQIAIVHIHGQLRVAILKLLNNPAAIDDVGMRDIGEELVEVKGAKGRISFAQDGQFRVLKHQGLLQGAMHTGAISLPRLVEDHRARLFGHGHRSISAVIADDNHPLHQRVGEKIPDGVANAALVIVGCQSDRQTAIVRRIMPNRFQVAQPADVQEKIPADERDAGYQRNAAIPNQIFIQPAKQWRIQKHPPHRAERNANHIGRQGHRNQQKTIKRTPGYPGVIRTCRVLFPARCKRSGLIFVNLHETDVIE